MMRPIIKGLFLVGMLFSFEALASARHDHVYLGGAYNVWNCGQIAGSYGYRTGVYGAGWDWQGIYYPYFNACFGSNLIYGPGLLQLDDQESSEDESFQDQ